MTANDVVNFFMNHPPVEVTDMAQYQQILNIVVQSTVQELSENDPIVEERDLTSPSVTTPGDAVVFIDLYTDIDPNFMELIALYEKDNPPNLYHIFNRQYDIHNSNGSLIDIIADRDALYSLREWFTAKKKFIIYSGTKIKVNPDTQYHVVYYRYRTLTELPLDIITIFKRLLEINLFLQFYKSDVLSSESQIRSVSISGLSVTFNVPSAETRIQTIQRLENEKNDILSSIALNYDDGEVGLIF